jgi:hypothetical protein
MRNLKKVKKGALVLVIKEPLIPIYGVKRRELFTVIENCMTSEPKAGLVCLRQPPIKTNFGEKHVYFNAEDFGRFVELENW